MDVGRLLAPVVRAGSPMPLSHSEKRLSPALVKMFVHSRKSVIQRDSKPDIQESAQIALAGTRRDIGNIESRVARGQCGGRRSLDDCSPERGANSSGRVSKLHGYADCQQRLSGVEGARMNQQAFAIGAPS